MHKAGPHETRPSFLCVPPSHTKIPGANCRLGVPLGRSRACSDRSSRFSSEAIKPHRRRPGRCSTGSEGEQCFASALQALSVLQGFTGGSQQEPSNLTAWPGSLFLLHGPALLRDGVQVKLSPWLQLLPPLTNFFLRTPCFQITGTEWLSLLLWGMAGGHIKFPSKSPYLATSANI